MRNPTAADWERWGAKVFARHGDEAIFRGDPNDIDLREFRFTLLGTTTTFRIYATDFEAGRRAVARQQNIPYSRIR